MAATVHVVLGTLANGLPVLDAAVNDADYLSDVSSSAQADITVPAALMRSADLYWCITANGGGVWALEGTNPTAVQGSGHFIPAGVPTLLRAAPGSKIAILDGP